MSLSDSIKPISYLKAHAAEIIRNIHERGEPLIITQNGEAKAVLQDIGEYERMQETLALLKILARGEKQIDEGRGRPAAKVLKDIRKKHGFD